MNPEEFEIDEGSLLQTLRTEEEEGPSGGSVSRSQYHNTDSTRTRERTNNRRRRYTGRQNRRRRYRRGRRNRSVNPENNNSENQEPIRPNPREELLPIGNEAELEQHLDPPQREEDPTRQERENRTRNEAANEAKGDSIFLKDEHTVRFATLNIQGLPTVNRDRYGKNNAIKESMNKYNIDALGMQEINRDWRCIPERY